MIQISINFLFVAQREDAMLIFNMSSWLRTLQPIILPHRVACEVVQPLLSLIKTSFEKIMKKTALRYEHFESTGHFLQSR